MTPPWARFLGARPQDVLEQQIFALLWHEWGYGLGLTYQELMTLPVRRFDAFLALRQEQLERVSREVKGG